MYFLYLIFMYLYLLYKKINDIFNKININFFNKFFLIMGIGDWGLGIGDWGLGIGPNPQSPIPKYFFY